MFSKIFSKQSPSGKRKLDLMPFLALIGAFAVLFRMGEIMINSGIFDPLPAYAASEETAIPTATGAPAMQETEAALTASKNTDNAEKSFGQQEDNTASTLNYLPERKARGIDPSDYKFSASEIELLQNLGKRRQEIELRARGLDEREALLNAAEARFASKARELENLKQEIRDYLKLHDKKQESQIKRLVKTYESMKPKDAARIFDTLAPETLLEVATRMKEAKIAPIMAAMDTKRAQFLTISLAKQGRIPGVSNIDRDLAEAETP